MTQHIQTKANTDFMQWWHSLNIEMDMLHHNQQVLYRDARNMYDIGYTPKAAAEALMATWEE